MIKIEVTGNSIPEVADKLLAIGASLRASAAIETPRGATKAEAAAGNVPQKSNAPKSAPVAEAIDSQPTTAEPSSTPVPVALASEELEVVDLPIDIETDLRTLVLKVVDKRGKPFMEEILSSFGVVKASHVKPARLPELIALCQEAISK